MSSTWVVHWKKQPYDIYIGRPSFWGNPFSWKDGTLAKFKVKSREESIQKHKEWFLSQPDRIERAKRDLKGKILGCWCGRLSCHGDILAEVANS